MKNDAPKVVKIHDVKIDQEYMQWLGEIKARYRNAQIRASVKINVEQLLFNWQLGRDLVMRKAEERWGSGIVEQVSLDLQAAFPESKGFSTTNLWYMKQWYRFYTDNGQNSTNLVEKSRLKSRLRSIFSQDCDGERYRYLLKLQLERPGHGKNAWAFPLREIKRNR